MMRLSSSLICTIVALTHACQLQAAPFVTAVGENGTILRSNDGGVSWTQQPLNITRELRAVDFVAPDRGWVSGKFELAGTTDAYVTMRQTSNGGASWQSADFLSHMNNVYVFDLDFISSDIGFLSGGLGNIWRTDDSGLTWNQLFPGESSDFYDVDFVSENVGWATGGTIVKTTDGGETWETQHRVFTASLFGASFVDENEGWAVGAVSQILHTDDGGETWSTQLHPSGGLLRAVDFVDSESGWIVGTDGTILHSNDGGLLWESQDSGTEEILNGLDFIDDMRGWAVGEKGTLLRTEDGGENWIPVPSWTDRTLHDVAAVIPEPSSGSCLALFLCIAVSWYRSAGRL